ncbi:phosphotransferase [Paenibacillus sp. CF384]|uniref:phosphotransferase n=1 Tax=Paenibacillus sp. CF384 TaxID=1884382 RepID=UPI0008950347|nr:phosphotransferase [Paenibacillus sp. CF384]SDX03876.1 Ser/Thr protein kinase RdoA involved in Cpx stress response, MazF antagonist [Paenibacillus sp. CF384]
MLKLPVNHSVISSNALMVTINDLYEVGDVTECRFLSNGLNDTYMLKTRTSKYVLRIYKEHWRKKNDVDFEVELLNHLNDKEIPVSAPVPRKDGGYVIELDAPEGERYAVLFTYAEGGYSDTKASSELYGEQVAKMHLAMNDFIGGPDRFKIDLEHLLKEPLHNIRQSKLLAHRPEDIDYLESLSQVLSSRIAEISSELEWGMCHGDLHGGNVHFHENTLTHFDFDCGGFGWRAYDVSVFLWVRVRGKEKEQYDNEHWVGFLDAYQKVKVLSEYDLKAIPVFVAIREIWLMGLHTSFGHVWGAWQDDHYFNTNLKFLRNWCEHHAIRATA